MFRLGAGPAALIREMIPDFLIPGAKVAIWGHVFTVVRAYLAPNDDRRLRHKKGDLIIERRGKAGPIRAQSRQAEFAVVQVRASNTKRDRAKR